MLSHTYQTSSYNQTGTIVSLSYITSSLEIKGVSFHNRCIATIEGQVGRIVTASSLYASDTLLPDQGLSDHAQLQ